MNHNFLWLGFIACLTFSADPMRASPVEPTGKSQNLRTMQQPAGQLPWVKVKGDHFVAGGNIYTFVGANLWYGASLGANGASGDRERLVRELDRLQEIGVRNLRVMASSEGPDSEPWRIVPALQPSPGVYNNAVLEGIDFLLAEMAKRGMYAVMCLSNYWQWSGGMAQYLRWNGAGPIPYPPPAKNGDWDLYRKYTDEFYENAGAKADLARHIRFMVTRINSVTGIKYTDDPTIMTWELANEPGTSKNVDAFVDWIRESAHLIKTLDPNHLVISGSEEPAFQAVTQMPDIDYATTHIWVQNSGWYDPLRPQETYRSALERARESLKVRREITKSLGKPLVLAEFGLARDDSLFAVSTPTTYRDHFYSVMMDQAYSAARQDLGIQGISFWAWAGEGRPREPGGYWHPGDDVLGDPPHEPQGWYSIYDEDESTLHVIQIYAAKMDALRHLLPAPTGQSGTAPALP